jgi:DNA-binding CsgD family transcriptional regulator/tetratricopeptide (TPR) repeat protein
VPGWLLERDAQLAVMSAAVRAAAGGVGSVVLVHGEAGIGKSSLVGALAAHLPAQARLLVGWCDALSTPRPLGPLRDLVASVGPRLARALTAGDRDEVLAGVQDELSGATVCVLVVEDVHWADEATLDVLRFLIRRISGMSAVLVLTYRDDEMGREHPLVPVLGEVGGSESVARLRLEPLSPTAVAALTEMSPLDAEHVFALTGGNPYFVTELLVTAGAGAALEVRRSRLGLSDVDVPATVVDAVLGRLRRLQPGVQSLVELLAVIPSALERRLVDALDPAASSALAIAEERGLLTVVPDRVAFRHELTRRAVVDALPRARRIELCRRVLAAFEEAGNVEPSRLLHLAVEAGDVEAMVTHAPVAAREAAGSGAHREAAEHYAVAAKWERHYEPRLRAALLEEWAIELYALSRVHESVRAQHRALDVRRELGETNALGSSLRWMSRMLWNAGDRAAAEAAAREATAVLEAGGQARLLALAVSNESQLAMLAHDSRRAIELARRVLPTAHEARDVPLLSHALTNLGLARFHLGDQEGLDDLVEAARVALAVDDIEDACRAYANIVWVLLDEFRLREAEQYLVECIEVAERSEFVGFLTYLEVEQARLELARGHWVRARSFAESALRGHPQSQCAAWTVLGTVAARLGDPGADEALALAQALADQMDEIQRLGPVGAARIERAMLQDDQAAAVALATPLWTIADRAGDRPLLAELRYRLRQAGRATTASVPLDHPFALQADGRWQDAAGAWERAGCPYHHAAALADGDDPDSLLRALEIFDGLGAAPLSRTTRRRLRVLGVPAPRGPVEGTRANPAGLTDRQLEVLRLVCEGLTNAEIAQRLVVSVRTVDSHVAAVLTKLGVRSRLHALRRAGELGVGPAVRDRAR